MRASPDPIRSRIQRDLSLRLCFVPDTFALPPVCNEAEVDCEMSGSRVTNLATSAAEEASERLDEIAEILAAGLMRLRSRQSSAESADFRECSVDCAAGQSGHANVLNGGEV